MKWYCAHLIYYNKFKDGIQDKYLIQEDIHLIRAKSDQEAFAKAEKMGKETEDCIGEITIKGRQTVLAFAGVRKVTLRVYPEEERPEDGTELTYLEYEIENEKRLKKLLNGKNVKLLLKEKFAPKK